MAQSELASSAGKDKVAATQELNLVQAREKEAEKVAVAARAQGEHCGHGCCSRVGVLVCRWDGAGPCGAGIHAQPIVLWT